MLQKTILATSIILFLSVITLAQTFEARVFGGLTASQVSGDQLGGYNQPGIHLGAEVSTEKNGWEYGFGMLYNQKGSRATSSVSGANQMYTLRLTYLDIPITVGRTFNKFKFNLGPSINILSKVRESDFYGNKEITVPFNSFDLSAVTSVLYQFKKKLGARITAGHSLLPIRKFEGNGVSFNNGQYNSWLSTSLVVFL